MDLFTLSAKLLLDHSEYDKGLDDSQKSASSFGESLKNGLGSAAKAGAAAIGAVGAGVGAMASKLISGVQDVAAYGDSIDKASQQLGISAQAY